MLKLLVTIVSVLVIIAADKSIVHVQSQPDRIHVRIQNDLGDFYTQLYAHCQSKDDDIGEHYIMTGHYIEWKFNMNIIGSTLFWCNFAWNSTKIRFDVYNAHHDDLHCDSQCWRSIRPDGAYFYHQYHPRNQWLKKISW